MNETHGLGAAALTDISDELLDAVVGGGSIVDPVLCPILGSLSPGVPGVVDIDPTGDTSIAGQPTWDCVPYDG
ncbi:MAG: hypothetical protein QOK43_2175 [Acidimicrobiaceae bacterium]|nr:hypothetical protein [Acidimicrobiaceae bacterium]